ncbi:recombination-associated protein RdgC [Hydrogenophaga sp. A37]|uniref:recombination-associated protein RdgC n=1 Tax=Hydrogenophaga sp. A37 TaxID=1945864 RepID=UPI000986BCED|nr:recombination-associated protein RdgC [Hydrogenophaga sp. A37]OOG79195.1 recombination-associated protein RdgC [Hydrogenophaga sp. A37]
MIKNATIYRIASSLHLLSLENMGDCLQKAAFVPCGATQDKAVGWVEPRGEAHGALVELIAGQRILKLMIETKAVPGSLVRTTAQAAADQIEAETSRRPGKKQMKELREDALLELLPNAFARQAAVWIWIDLNAGLLVIGSTSRHQIDETVTALVSTFGHLQLQLLQTKVTPQSAMTNWLSAEDPEHAWVDGFSIERECELRSADEEKSVIRFTRHSLGGEQVRKHITEGKLPTRLALSWEGRVGFVLTESMQLKKITFLEGVLNDRPEDGESSFDTDVALTTGELGKLIPALVEALGGELVVGSGLPDAPGGA